MVGYITIGTNDFERSAKFYDVLLAELGATRMMDTPEFIAWTATPEGCALSITRPFDGKPATVGNGVMIAFTADSNDLVDKVYAKALQLGGSDEGVPGPRGNGFYAGYFRDLDGNKLNIFYTGS